MAIGESALKGWMVAGLAGDAAAHAQLLRAVAPLLRSFYRRRLRAAEDDIEDIVQETLIAVHERRATFDRERPFTPWLYAIARYKMVDQWRRNSRLRPLDVLEGEIAVDSGEDGALAAIDLEALLATLPPKQARSIRDTKLHGLSVAEAADAAGIGESDVKVSVHRGLKALAEHVRRLGR